MPGSVDESSEKIRLKKRVMVDEPFEKIHLKRSGRRVI